MKIFQVLGLCLPLAIAAGHAQAQDDSQQGTTLRNTFYIGAGAANDDGPLENDDTPFSFGFLHQRPDSKLILGFDIGREGTMLDSTWGMDDRPKQATSYNFLIGGNLMDNGRFRTDAALLLGVRESFADCADSYLGFQCYADEEPDTDYKGNFGAVVTLSVDKFTLGLRATGESTQILAGFRF
ncbi:hypothetical protein SAMN05421641_102234 [Paracoccus thiocyanatus]|uniref:Outer membrane protein beta-barrel domain-containing protein n=1 Tax=Paracoccus thiocyanatus TaxID=34006 RepID=A0A1N6P3Y7_9RHOB|nr:hypothetical protein [Paracoccus thiocyanatus]SIP99019.1 hypothetical protein SAMN05421641_102234 [Paracoccus thiocyanatus]